MRGGFLRPSKYVINSAEKAALFIYISGKDGHHRVRREEKEKK